MFHELSMAKLCMEDHLYMDRPATSEGRLLVATVASATRLQGVGHDRTMLGRLTYCCWPRKKQQLRCEKVRACLLDEQTWKAGGVDGGDLMTRYKPDFRHTRLKNGIEPLRQSNQLLQDWMSIYLTMPHTPMKIGGKNAMLIFVTARYRSARSPFQLFQFQKVVSFSW